MRFRTKIRLYAYSLRNGLPFIISICGFLAVAFAFGIAFLPKDPEDSITRCVELLNIVEFKGKTQRGYYLKVKQKSGKEATVFSPSKTLNQVTLKPGMFLNVTEFETLSGSTRFVIYPYNNLADRSGPPIAEDFECSSSIPDKNKNE